MQGSLFILYVCKVDCLFLLNGSAKKFIHELQEQLILCHEICLAVHLK